LICIEFLQLKNLDKLNMLQNVQAFMYNYQGLPNRTTSMQALIIWLTLDIPFNATEPSGIQWYIFIWMYCVFLSISQAEYLEYGAEQIQNIPFIYVNGNSRGSLMDL